MLFSFLSLQMELIFLLTQIHYQVNGKQSTQKNVKVQFSQVKNSHRIASIFPSRPLQNIETNIEKRFFWIQVVGCFYFLTKIILYLFHNKMD